MIAFVFFRVGTAVSAIGFVLSLIALIESKGHLPQAAKCVFVNAILLVRWLIGFQNRWANKDAYMSNANQSTMVVS